MGLDVCRSCCGHLVGACASGERVAPRVRTGAGPRDRAFDSQGGAIKRHGPPLHTGVVPTTTSTGQATSSESSSITTTTSASVTTPYATSEQTSESTPATTEGSSSESPSVSPSVTTAKFASVTTTTFASATTEYALVTTAV